MCLITGSFHLVHLSSILKGLLLGVVPLAGYGSGPFIIPLAGFEWPQPGFLSSLDLVRRFNSAFPPLPEVTGASHHRGVSSEKSPSQLSSFL